MNAFLSVPASGPRVRSVTEYYGNSVDDGVGVKDGRITMMRDNI